jgi:hypothetical protein
MKHLRVAGAALGAAGLVAAAPVPLQAETVPVGTLERIAARLSGLPVTKLPVRVVVLPRARLRTHVIAELDRRYAPRLQATDALLYRSLGLLAPSEQLRPALVATETTLSDSAYDERTHTVYALEGKGARGRILRELVHALQDGRFNLSRTFAARAGDRDATLAAEAVLDGHAALSTVATTTSHTAAPPPSASKIRYFLSLKRSFPAVGTRLLVALENLGGRPAAATALTRLPTTTAEVFHLDAFLERRGAPRLVLPPAASEGALVGSSTFGELDVRALLATFAVPRLDAAANGWTAGASAVFRQTDGSWSTALRLDWDSERDVDQWADAVRAYVNQAFPAPSPPPSATTACGSDTCWTLTDRALAFRRVGQQTALVVAPTADAAEALALTLLPVPTSQSGR